jgi:molybdopterin-guanine dinucleotide biosynthesis protein A
MGRDKALLPFHGVPLAHAVAHQVEQAAGSVTFVGHQELGGIADCFPGEGPLGGILTAMRHSRTEWNLIVACDMPGLSTACLARLLAAAAITPAEIILPFNAGGRPEPLCAVYSRRALPALEAAFARGVRKVTAAFEGIPVERLDLAEVADFQNVNTPEDWSEYAGD